MVNQFFSLGKISFNTMLPNPEGMAVHSQGRQPLGEERTNRVNAEGVAVRLPPFQGYTICSHRFQGLTPLAIYCQPLRGLTGFACPVVYPA